jgi:Domain of unknown function (DUF3846)
VKKAVTLKAMKLLSDPNDPVMEFETRGAIGEVEFNDENSLRIMQEAVGGYIECISLRSRGIAMFCNEESKIKNNPIKNIDATNLYQEEYETSDWIAGDVIFTSLATDDEGNTMGLTDDQRTWLLDKIHKMQEERSGVSYFIPVLH